MADEKKQMGRPKPSFTPGPWVVELGVVHAPRCSEKTHRDQRDTESVLSFNRPHEEREANARLMAAAPRMLDLLKEIERRTNALKPLWEGSLDSPERAHNETRNYVLGNVRALIAAIESKS